MAIKTTKLGPGILTIGEVASPLDMTAQVTACKIAWSVDKEDNVPVLSGEELEGEADYTAQLSATVLQELSDDGIIDWTWANKGTVVPFTFTPNSAEGKSVTGMVRVDPIDLGGDVKKKNTSELEWDCVGEPTLSAGV